MGAYGGQRTENVLRRAKKENSEQGYQEALAAELKKTKVFIDDPSRPPVFSALANTCRAASHLNCANINDLDAIDWSKWRLSVEFNLLQYRVDAVTKHALPVMSKFACSSLLDLAIGLSLTGRQSLAQPMFERLATFIPPTLDEMVSRKNKPRQWGAIAVLFQDVLDASRVPTRLQIAPPETLEEAQAARATYCDARDPYGSLLGGSGSDLIPIELIYFARKLGHPDPVLAFFDQQIQDTTYPTDEGFQELDMELSIAGL